jgi:asparagine N-glycosylation enzyme membrane subunit Stt3
MGKIIDLYNGSFIVILLLTIFIFVYYYKKEENKIEDLNHDGKIELYEIWEHFRGKEKNKPPNIKNLIKSSSIGILRGFLMGFLIGGFEGSFVTAITLGLVNPIITVAEYIF